MKSSICSPRTIRKFFLVGAVLLSNCTLQSTIVFATCVLQKTNPSQTRFSIKLQNATLEEFVKQVEQKTGYSFIYGEEVRLNGRITLAVRDLTINEILRKAFENQPIGFEVSGKHFAKQAARAAENRKPSVHYQRICDGRGVFRDTDWCQYPR